ncbi:hypothetical protein [Streptomyces sp. NPDC101455]|uniref:hypothetical protein n=1 Tax=Streptomyces sp. NPDC101455 TaxID=3366142 RepID=UPI0038253758
MTIRAIGFVMARAGPDHDPGPGERAYAVPSSIFHGRSAGPGQDVALDIDLLGAARELLVPLPARVCPSP